VKRGSPSLKLAPYYYARTLPFGATCFFIKMLTAKGDFVLDIFAGFNTTEFAAEALNPRWLAFELNQKYLTSSVLRFLEG